MLYFHIQSRYRISPPTNIRTFIKFPFRTSTFIYKAALALCGLYEIRRRQPSNPAAAIPPTPQGRMIAESPDRIQVLIPNYKNAWHLDTSVIAGLTGNHQQYQHTSDTSSSTPKQATGAENSRFL